MTLARGSRLLAALLLAICARPATASSWIVAYPAPVERAARNHGVTVWAREGDTFVGGAEEDQIAALEAEGVSPRIRVADEGQWLYVLTRRDAEPAPQLAGVASYPLSPETDLFVFPADRSVVLPRVKPHAGFMAVARVPLPVIAPHPADLAGPEASAPSTINPLVQQIVDATSQALWFQDVKDLSGENPVTIDGVERTIRTRYSDAMFPTPQSNAYATEYLLDKAEGWGYAGVREPYTAADSGCGGVQGATWQNVVFTLPGQVDFGQHQQVLFVNHYDTISFSTAESFSYAPGADDAISGGSALLEALRLFKDYGFKNTIKIAFFSGEEVGICGSGAYVRQHPSSDMWRAVNMDQTAFDGNQDLKMNCYNWDVTNSPASVALGDAFVQANSDYGTIIDPSKIIRDGGKMCQTDHCPFWNVGVGSIALLENLHDGDICPCFDLSQTPTCHDTVTQMFNGKLMFTQSYSWPTEKAAVAVVAALAEPLYACPPSAPAPTVAPGNNTMHLTWPGAAGVTSYVVERAATCAGPFTAIASSPSTSWDDNAVANGSSYGYRIRTCPTQTGACVSGSPVAGASVVADAATATVVEDSGDHDNVPDDCELVTVQLSLRNDGNVPLTNARLASVTSSHPGVEVVSALPQIVPSLAAGASAPVAFKFYLGRNGSSAACGEALPFTVAASSDEAPVSTRTFQLVAERDAVAGPLTYGFETDFSGWTVTSGSFTRAAGGAGGSTAFSLHSRNQNNDCDAAVSPTIVPTATSTLTMWVNYGIENGSFDRAVVRAVDTTTGIKSLLTPTGANYNTNGDTNLLCDNLGNLRGWSGSFRTWRQATFSLGAFAGVPIQLDVRYSTDAFSLGAQGFWMDLVQITDTSQSSCDAQPDVCAALPSEVSPAGDPVPLTVVKSGTDYSLTFSEVAGAVSYHVYAGTLAALRGGVYDHAERPGLCGLADAAPGDGSVTATVAGADVPDGSYFLAVARNGAGESPYGAASSGAPIPLALDSCP
jgi:hypothetical protein